MRHSILTLALGLVVTLVGCPPPAPPKPMVQGNAIGGRRVSCRGPTKPAALAAMQSTNADLAAGNSRKCPDCLDQECLLENQIVFGADANGFDGQCAGYENCLCGCTTEECRTGCLSVYPVACQTALGALDSCRRTKCASTCQIVLLYEYGKGDAGPPRDAGPAYEQACRQPPVSGGSLYPCCDLFGRCCQMVPTSDQPTCESAYGEVRTSNGGCQVKLLDWIDRCPGIQP